MIISPAGRADRASLASATPRQKPALPETPGRQSADHDLPPGNNFDLLRLLAAFQVVVYHCSVLLAVPVGLAADVLNSFPGVSIFFVMSGFLLTGSLQADARLLVYARNRALRIYPALWASFAFTVITIATAGYLGAWALSIRGLAWVVGQLVVAKGTPSELRHYGDGTPNGSLWTVSLEIAFYILLAVLFVLVIRHRRHVASAMVAALLLASLAAYAGFHGIGGIEPIWNFQLASEASYVWLFLAGVLVRLNWRTVRKIVSGRGTVWCVAYVVLVAAAIPAVGLPWLVASTAALAAQLIMPLWILALAFTWPGLSRRLLGRTDISYGVYLYHFPIINIILAHVSRPYLPVHAGLVVLTTTTLGLLSWHLIEKRALRLKAPGTLLRSPQVQTLPDGPVVSRA